MRIPAKSNEAALCILPSGTSDMPAGYRYPPAGLHSCISSSYPPSRRAASVTRDLTSVSRPSRYLIPLCSSISRTAGMNFRNRERPGTPLEAATYRERWQSLLPFSRPPSLKFSAFPPSPESSRSLDGLGACVHRK